MYFISGNNNNNANNMNTIMFMPMNGRRRRWADRAVEGLENRNTLLSDKIAGMIPSFHSNPFGFIFY